MRSMKNIFKIPLGPVSELPGLGWLCERFDEAARGEAMGQQHRRRVLAACHDGAADQGPIVCSCHQVGRTPIQRAIRAGDDSVEALGARLACGTQCGSCIPELKSLVEEEKSRGRIERAQPQSA